MDQISSSDLQFSKEKTKYPTPNYPELDKLSTETLIGIFEGLRGSAHMKKTKEMYFSDKRSGFQTNPEKYYRDYLGFEYIAPLYLREDGKINLEYLIGLIPKEGEWLGKREEEMDGMLDSVEDLMEKLEMEGYFDDDSDDDCDEKDEVFDYEKDDHEIGGRNLILMGKQILVKIIEGGNVDAEWKKASVRKADWAIANNGGAEWAIDIDGGVLADIDDEVLADSVLFMNSQA